MLTQEDTTADELGVTDADVAEWDAIVARYKTHPEEFKDYKTVMAELKAELEAYRAERKKQV
jgi:hypothetical protein